MRCIFRCALCAYISLSVASLYAITPVSIEDGYAQNWSNRPGEPATFYISSDRAQEDATLVIYDTLDRPVASVSATVASQQLSVVNLAPWRNGYGYEPVSIDMPDIPSGIYRLDGPELSSTNIPFIVNDPEETADIVVIYPTNTVNAYSQSPNPGHPDFRRYSVVNLYSRDANGKHPDAVSFHRTQNRKVWGTKLLDRVLLQSDYSYKYISDHELEDYDAIAGAKMVVIPGHSEYWTENARRNFDKFVDHGGSGLVLSGNAMFRKVEYDDPENPTLLKFSPRRQFTSASLGYPTWQSIGADFKHGGNGSKFPTSQAINMPYGGYKMLDVSKPYLEDAGLAVGDIMENPTVEWDGVPYTSLDPVTGPVIDTELLGFHEISLIGFDNASYGGMMETAGTWIDFKKTEESGRIINVGSMSWTADGHGRDLKRQVTRNMIDYLLIDQVDFDEDNRLTGADIDLLREEMRAESPRMRFDLSADGVVDGEDFDRFLYDYAQATMGDANLDRRVDFRDFILLAKKFNLPSGWSGGDFDGNQVADFRDFLLLATNFDKEQPRTQPIPEPDAFYSALLAVAMLTLIARKGRRD